MSIPHRKTKLHSRKFKPKWKSKKFRKKPDDMPKDKIRVFDRSNDGSLTADLFEADEGELRAGLKAIAFEIGRTRRGSSKKKRLQGYKKIVSDRLDAMGLKPETHSKAQVMGYATMLVSAPEPEPQPVEQPAAKKESKTSE